MGLRKSSKVNLRENKYAARLTAIYEGWNFNSGNYLFTTDTK